MSELKMIINLINNPNVLRTTTLILIAIIIYMVKAFAINVKKQLDKIITNEKEKWGNVNNRLDEISVKLGEIDETLKTNNETTVALIYHQCLNEAMKWQDKGYIELGAKKYFDSLWNNYIKLGDGLGTEPKDIVDKLRINN